LASIRAIIPAMLPLGEDNRGRLGSSGLAIRIQG